MQYSHRNLLIHFCSRLNASLWSKAHLFRKVFRFNLSASSEVQSTTFNSNFYWNCNTDGLREELLTFMIFFLFLPSLTGFMRKYIRQIVVEDVTLPTSILIWWIPFQYFQELMACGMFLQLLIPILRSVKLFPFIPGKNMILYVYD